MSWLTNVHFPTPVAWQSSIARSAAWSYTFCRPEGCGVAHEDTVGVRPFGHPRSRPALPRRAIALFIRRTITASSCLRSQP